MADVVESLEVGWVIPPKAVGAFLFFLNLGRVEGFGFDGKGSRAKSEPENKIMSSHLSSHTYIVWDGQRCNMIWGTATQNDIQGIRMFGNVMRNEVKGSSLQERLVNLKRNEG